MIGSSVGPRLKKTRERKVLTQRQLADRSGVPIVTISRIENGHHDPYATTVQKLANALGVAAEWLAWGEEQP